MNRKPISVQNQRVYGKLLRVFFLRFYLFIFRDSGREGEREEEKYQCVVASCTPHAEDLACNPGMCPDWESNQQPYGFQSALKPLSYTSQGPLSFVVSLKLLYREDFKTRENELVY